MKTNTTIASEGIRKFIPFVLCLISGFPPATLHGKQPIAAGNPALKQLLSEADKPLKVTPGSVMDKKKTAPGGDQHDYLSLAPEFNANRKWPDNQIKEIKHPDEALAALLRRAAIAYHEPKYEALLQDRGLAACRFQLVWPFPSP